MSQRSNDGPDTDFPGVGPVVSRSPDLIRLRLDIAYDGTDFAGWAIQPGRRTVAGSIAEALRTLFRSEIAMVVAGRTDAGVHASGQVAHIDVPGDALDSLAPRHRRGAPPVETADRADSPEQVDGGSHASGRRGLSRRLAGLLPPDVRVAGVHVAPTGFDARFSALRRHYRYRISTAEWGVDPLRRNDIYGYRRPLDVPAMNAAAAALVGLHDFAAFCQPREGATTIRELQRLTVIERDAEVRVEVSADAFCHSMVRSLVGALLAVGSRRAEVDRPARLLAGARRTAEIAVAPARGLTLVGVDYPADGELALRAHQTRAVRNLAAVGTEIDFGPTTRNDRRGESENTSEDCPNG